MTPKKWYLSCREIQLDNPAELRRRLKCYVSVASFCHNTILAADLEGRVERFTVDPTTLAITEHAQLLGLSVDTDTMVIPVLVSDVNQTVLVSNLEMIGMHAREDGDYRPSPLGVYVFYPDTGLHRHLEFTQDSVGPLQRRRFSAVVVDETLVVLGGFYYVGNPTNDPIPQYRFPLDIWCLDMHNVDIGETWRRVSMKQQWPTEDPSVFGCKKAICTVGNSLGTFFGSDPLDLSHLESLARIVSLRGQTSLTDGVFTDKALVPGRSIHIGFEVAVNMGAYICLFGWETQDTAEADDVRTHCVYMFDQVSGDYTLHEPLTFPNEVLAACMLNPTTMLVLQEERTLVLELDPQLFERFTDAH
ncbi:hypothetical protein KIPB_001132 [Kipferlia bialata]|uniref:Uncharacterized protein n=1 Tax=Kipferlia bialata TaxID=797122 RepID=A0A9K3GFJ5_9EUKA|nr:hypothetical protein KIPB_001132 [Kipferlia bialata]|eukprot:g1132.t1